MRRTAGRALTLVAATACLFGHASVARAQQTLYWSGTSGTSAPLWSTLDAWSIFAGSWTPPGAVPGANDTVVFSLASLLDAQAVYLNGDQSALGLVFSTTNATTILGGDGTTPAVNTLTLGSGGITVSGSAGTATLGSGGANDVSILLGAPQTWTVLGGLYYDPVDQLTIGVEAEYYTTDTSATLYGDSDDDGENDTKLNVDGESENFTVDLVSVWRF
jgi:hypothetical protein